MTIPINHQWIGNNMIEGTQGQDEVIAPAARKLNWRLLLAAGVVLAAGVFAWPTLGLWSAGIPSIDSETIKFSPVTRGDLVRDIAVSGKLVAANAPQIYSPEPGTVTLLVKPGDSVNREQAIATIDSPELTAQLRQAQSELDKLTITANHGELAIKEAQLDLQRELDSARLNLAAAQREKERTDLSYQKQVISEQTWAKSQDELLAAQVHYQHASRKVKLAEERLKFEQQNRMIAVSRQKLVVEELQRRSQATQIHAPVSGVVGNWLVSQKDRVADSTALMTIVDLSRYEAEFGVPEFYADDLGLGLTVNMGIAGSQISGKVIAISPEINGSEIKIRVSVTSADGLQLRQNQRVNGRIEFENKQQVLMVRRGAFMGDGGSFVYRLDGDGLASRQPIRTGVTSVEYVEILSGLSEGEQIISSSYEAFIDYDTIKINN